MRQPQQRLLLLTVLLLTALLCLSCTAAASPEAPLPQPAAGPPAPPATVPPHLSYDTAQPVIFADGPATFQTITYQLQPATDYGPLLYFQGWPDDRCGLFTREGRAVTLFASYYRSIEQPRYQVPINDYQYLEAPVLILREPAEPSQRAQVPDTFNPSPNCLRVAALDGSWLTSGLYSSYRVVEEGIFLLKETGQGLFLEWDGSVRWQLEDPRLLEAGYVGIDFYPQHSPNILVTTQYEPYATCFIDQKSGEVSWLSDISLGGVFNGSALAPSSHVGVHDLYGYVDESGAWRIEPQYAYAGIFHQGLALVQRPDGVYLVIDEANQPVHSFPAESTQAESILWEGGAAYIGLHEQAGEDYPPFTCTGYYTTEQGELGFNPVGRDVKRSSNHYKTDAVYFPDETGLLLLRGATSCRIEQADHVRLFYDYAVYLRDLPNYQQDVALLNWRTGETVIPYGNYRSIDGQRLGSEGSFYFRAIHPDDRMDYLNTAGEIFFSTEADAQLQVHENLLLYPDGQRLLAYDWQGNLLWQANI